MLCPRCRGPMMGMYNRVWFCRWCENTISEEDETTQQKDG